MFRAGKTVWAILTLVGSIMLASTEPASAHAFGQRYDLPVPLELYLLAAAAAVALSFVVIAAFVRGAPQFRPYPRVNLLRYRVGRLLAHRSVILVLKLVSVGLFVLVVVAGFVGNQHPLRNLAPALVWIIWWVGLAYVSAFVGNLWALINPWRITFGWAQALCRRIFQGRELSLHLPYPGALGVWPGLTLLLTFSWIELVFPEPAIPANIAWMAVGYSVVTWTGMFLFGKEQWLRQGEVFSVLFGLLARFGATELRVSRRDVCKTCGLGCIDRDGQCVDCYKCFGLAEVHDREWNLRPYAVGLLRNEAVSTSMMAFVLLMLSMVLFDGFLATPAWANLQGFVQANFSGSGEAFLMSIKTVGLVAFWLLFLGAYLATCWFMAAVSGGQPPGWEIARIFALTLVPIAIAYHLAHYLTYLLVQGQYIIPLASDPFGFGWNLLGTAGYRINIAVVGARFAWYTAVITIVVGHIVAVYLAHHRAVRTLADRRSALRSQYPMTALMIAYTVTSLSILAEPIVKSPAAPAPTAAEEAPSTLVRIPEDAVIPLAGSGRLMEVGADKYAKAKLTYKSMASAFHDGTQTTAPDVFYPYIFAYRWGVRGSGELSRYDPYIDATTGLIRERVAALRITGVDRATKSIRFGDLSFVRELHVIEVYLNATTEDLQDAAAIAPPWSSVPWHVIVLMEEAVSRGWAAFSQAEAARRGVEWLDLVRTKRTQGRLASLVEEFERAGYRPDALKELVTAEQAQERWAALKAFYQERGHFLVTNGPYILKNWSQEATVLEVFRDLSYPLGIGSYDSYPIPRRAYISKIELTDTGLRVLAEVDRVEKFQRTYEIVRKPFARGTSTAGRTETPVCHYLVVASDGKVVLTGRGRLQDDATFAVDLNGKLSPGVYTIMTALFLGGNTMNPDIKRIS
ncbi:MAG: hypothetical protein ACE5NW_12445, partial [Acidiferrobacterales bacterium]